MDSSAPARSGFFFVRHAPRSTVTSAALFALLLSVGCAQLEQSPDRSPMAGASATGAAPAQAASGPAQSAPISGEPAEPPGAGAADQAQHDDEAPATASGASPGTTPGAAPDASGAIPRVELSSQLLFQILASEIAAQRGQIGSATTTYLAMARQTRDPRLAQRAAELALAERSAERALPAARLWHELSPRSERATRVYEGLLLAAGQLSDAEPLLRQRLATARAQQGLASAYPQIQSLLARSPERDAAFALLDRLAEPDGKVVHARLALAAQARLADLDGRANAEAEAALELAPDDEDVAVTATRVLGQGSGGPSAAIEQLTPFVARHPKAIDARIELARWLSLAQRRDDARTQFERALAQDPQNPSVLFSLAQNESQSNRPQAAERYLQRFVALPENVRRNNAPAWLFLGQLAEEADRIDEAIDYYGRVGRGDQYVAARARQARLTAKSRSLEEGRALLQQTPAGSNRERVQLLSAEAQLLREAGRPDEAFKLLDDALARSPEDPELLYDQAMAAERIERLDVMEASLRKLIDLRPDHAHAYNALGYTFADRNLRLDEAAQLIDKALELRPDDAHILDSMGWVRYRQGRLSEALDYLRRAHQKSPDADIGAHLAEVLWQLDRREEAMQLLRDAAGRDADNETLRNTLRRLGVAL